MYDGIKTDAREIAKIIQPGDLVAYYIDGDYAWTQNEIGLFPNHQHVTITVLGNPADVADCETGDMSPFQAAQWVIRQKARGYLRPTVYRSLSVMKDVRDATGVLAMGTDWDAWVADYDNNPANVYPGAAAKQFQNSSFFDKSEVYDDLWPHRIKLAPVPPSVTVRWPVGVVLQIGNVGNAVKALQQALANSGLYGVRGIDDDGVFGLQTQTAVHNFEAAAKLTQDVGIAGNQVRNALIHMGLLTADGVAT
jgi:hypothetical protein